MNLTRVTIYFIILNAIILVIYTNTEPNALLNELHNSILINATEQLNNENIYKLLNINTTRFNTKFNEAYAYVTTINIEFITGNAIKHINIIKALVLVSIVSVIVIIIVIQWQTLLYKHEIINIKRIIYLITILISTVFVFIKELTTNNIIKKNINSTELLYTDIPVYSILIIVLTLILYIYCINNKYEQQKESESSLYTKVAINIIILIVINISAPYSIYETVALLLYAELLQQMLNIKRVAG